MKNKWLRMIGTIGLFIMLISASYPSPAAASTFQVVAPLGVSQPSGLAQTLVSLTSPVHRGANATIIVRSKAGMYCTITVYYKSGPSKAKGLEPKTAGSDGRCAWTWKVGTNTTLGTWKIVVKTGVTSKTYLFVVN